jgi:hypothetical protein
LTAEGAQEVEGQTVGGVKGIQEGTDATGLGDRDRAACAFPDRGCNLDLSLGTAHASEDHAVHGFTLGKGRNRLANAGDHLCGNAIPGHSAHLEAADQSKGEPNGVCNRLAHRVQCCGLGLIVDGNNHYPGSQVVRRLHWRIDRFEQP